MSSNSSKVYYSGRYLASTGDEEIKVFSNPEMGLGVIINPEVKQNKPKGVVAFKG